MPHDGGMNEGRDRNEREREAREPEGSSREQRENASGREDRGSDRRRQADGGDVMHGRDFAGTNIAATEREQTLDAERAKRGVDSTDEFVTEAELNARESRAQGNED